MTTHQNHYLFSDYYLNEILSEHEAWKGVDVKKPFEDLAELYKKVKDLLPGSNEAQTEERFIRPALNLLGHLFEVQPPVETAFGTRTPDYAFFPDEEAKKKAHKCRGKKEYFNGVLGVGDAKYWDRPLDKKLSVQGDPFENNNPNFQIDTYLRSTETRWGILTNGRLWRLYNRNTSYRLDTYYQVDLIQLLEQPNLEAFKYFYLLFRKEAFLPLYEGKTFLDRIYEGSLDYAKRVGAGLKENVYESPRLLATGFLKMEKNGLGQKDLEDIRSNSLVLLYRLLFMLYAEARNLLPLDNPSYRNNYSLDSLRKEIRDKLDKGETLVPEAALYHSRLKGLFELINSGSEKMGVPAYNGGLFKPENHPFLEDYAVGDNFAVQVIDKLSRSEEKDRGKVFVDYRSLDVRDLGSIYEGLLEYKLRLAEEDLVVTKKNNYIPLREAQGNPSQEIIRKGELYLATDKGERKATGSYYTPEYIVNYIVENTLGPVVEKAEADIRQKCKELEGKIKASRGSNREAYQKELGDVQTSLDDEVLKLKVLDPAMGSGHFLVRATEFLAEHIATNPYAHDAHTPEGESAIDYWKRRVVEHCIYGVDDNPLAVELAKLSLWLKTVARGKPLSFLDHHLRCGNSLIGAWVKDLGRLPEIRIKGSRFKGSRKASQVGQIEFDFATFTQDMVLAVGDMLNIEQRPTDTIKDVEEKTRILHYLDETRRKKYRQIANLWTSTYFGNELEAPVYQDAINILRGKSTGMTPEQEIQAYLSKAQSLSSQKHFFHWELEFPEVFFDKFGKRPENPGFDVVMGNPPYSLLQGTWYQDVFKNIYPEIFSGSNDISHFFLRKGIDLINKNGVLTFIVTRYWLEAHFTMTLRRFLCTQARPSCIIDFGNQQVWPDVNVLAVICSFVRDQNLKKCKLLVAPEVDNVTCEELLKLGKRVPQKYLKEISTSFFDERPWYLRSTELKPIWDKLQQTSVALEDIMNNTQGIKAGCNEAFTVSSETARILEKKYLMPLVQAMDIKRYCIEERGEYVIYTNGSIDIEEMPLIKAHLNQYKSVLEKRAECNESLYPWWRLQRPRDPNIIKAPIRLLVPLYATKNRFSVTENNYVGMTDVYVISIKNRNYSCYYLCCVLNSLLLDAYHKNFCKKKRAGYLEFSGEVLSALPIRRIAFVTPERERTRLAEEAKGMYYEGLKETAVQGFKRLLGLVGQCLEKIHTPDPELVKRHNAEDINKDCQIPEDAPWEQSDVVHDILAFLAEEMIRLNKEKQAEIKGFLDWLESEIGAKINDLKGKTKIKEYYEGDFERLWNTFKDNSLSLGRDFHDRLKEEFEKGLNKLVPLREKIDRTDWLIDQIVYKLYGLTEEEIGVVEKGSRV